MHEKRSASAAKATTAVPSEARPAHPAAGSPVRRPTGVVVHAPAAAESRARRKRASRTAIESALARDPLESAVDALALEAGTEQREFESGQALHRARRELRARNTELRRLRTELEQVRDARKRRAKPAAVRAEEFSALQATLERARADAAAAINECTELRRVQEGWRAATALRDERIAELARERTRLDETSRSGSADVAALRASLAVAESGRADSERARAAIESETASLRETTEMLRSTLGMREDALTAARSAERVAHDEEIGAARRAALAATRRAEEECERRTAVQSELTQLRASLVSLQELGAGRDAEAQELHRLLGVERAAIESRDEEIERLRGALDTANETRATRDRAEQRLDGELRAARRTLEARDVELEALRASMNHARQLLQWNVAPSGTALVPRATAESLRCVAEPAASEPPASDAAPPIEPPQGQGEETEPAASTWTEFELAVDGVESSPSAAASDSLYEIHAESAVREVFEHDVRPTRLEDADLSVRIGESPEEPAVPDDETDGDRVDLRRSSSLWMRLADRVIGRERRSAPTSIVRPLRCLATSATSTADLSLALSPSAPATASFEYWVTKFVRPKLEACGIESLEAFFLDPLVARCRENPRHTVSVLSLGAATGELEVRLASMARAEGITNFRIDCMATDSASLIPGRELATERRVGAHVQFLHRTLAQWTGGESYALCLAVDVLHRLPRLEATLDRVHRALGTDGVLLTVERTGANAHARWPEARSILDRIWRLMPSRYKTLASNGAVESDFDAPPHDEHDGVRASDVLPELMARFQAGTFVAFGNLVEPFVHPRFGDAIDPANEEDRRFIDRVAEIDDAKIDAGALMPTRIVAAWHTGTVERTKTWRERTPEACLRRATGGET